MPSFTYATGRFTRVGSAWLELDGRNNPINGFQELIEARHIVVLYDATRLLLIRLPKEGGMSRVMELDGEWNDLYLGEFSG